MFMTEASGMVIPPKASTTGFPLPSSEESGTSTSFRSGKVNFNHTGLLGLHHACLPLSSGGLALSLHGLLGQQGRVRVLRLIGLEGRGYGGIQRSV